MAAQRFRSEADAAEAKAPNIPARATTHRAAIAHTDRKFALAFPSDHGLFCHNSLSSIN